MQLNCICSLGIVFYIKLHMLSVHSVSLTQIIPFCSASLIHFFLLILSDLKSVFGRIIFSVNRWIYENERGYIAD